MSQNEKFNEPHLETVPEEVIHNRVYRRQYTDIRVLQFKFKASEVLFGIKVST